MIITGSFGNGYMQVTQSIVNQSNEVNLNHLSAIQHDLFMEAHPIMASIYRKWYINSFRYSRNTYKRFYYSRPNELDKCFYKYYGSNKLISLLIKEKPNLILLTFPTPVISVLTEQFNINIPVVTVMTDYHIHKNWITSYSQRYYVATKDAKDDFIEAGVPVSYIKVTGIPIADKFEESIDKEEWLSQQHLDPSEPTILMSVGALGASKDFDYMINNILEKSPNSQVVMIYGRNKKFKRSLKARFKDNPSVIILGYTDHMNEWMASSQLVITKPGGTTISKGLSRCIPMIFLNPTPGQEPENVYYFENKGFGKTADTPNEAVDIVSDLTNNEETLKVTSSKMLESKAGCSTRKICKDLLDLIGHSSQPDEIYGKVPLCVRFFVK